MNFKQLEAFYWLTRLKSYQRVADHIGLTQPAVSARISGLEDSLGIPLVDRAQSDFTLTEQGYEVAEYAETFLNLSETLTSRLKSKQKDVIRSAWFPWSPRPGRSPCATRLPPCRTRRWSISIPAPISICDPW
ncbi:LysR family transcriptional regulator [Neorhizobium galegae]|nr:LysR family transcriptional regulator [Neorhizobium galegae]